VSGRSRGPRSGPLRWLHAYLWMLRFDVASTRTWLGFYVFIQMTMSAGTAVLYGFYLPHLTPRLATFIVTGTPALALIPIGFVALPSRLAEQKSAGSYEFLRSLPVPRSAAIASMATFFTALAIPGLVLALALASWRYGVTLSVSPLVVPAVLLTALVASSLGAGIGYGIANPIVTNLMANLVVFFVLLFSPVAFPPSQYPHWFVRIHEALPFYNMATVLRGALSSGLASGVGRAYAVLGAWTIAGLALSAAVTSRRA
jgi:ABC-2 type transport system permease protein